MKIDQTVPLNVEFKEKEQVRDLGAYFEQDTKNWCVPANTNLIPFRPWLPAEFCKALDNGGLIHGFSLSHFLKMININCLHKQKR